MLARSLAGQSPRVTRSKACWLFPFQAAELQRVQKVRDLELVYARAQLELEVKKAQQLAEVEVKKFTQMTEALGPSTIRDLAVAGPEMQVRVGTVPVACVCVLGPGLEPRRQSWGGRCI